jgi:hypothetical protein
MYKIELDENGIIRSKCTIPKGTMPVETLEDLKKIGLEGIFVSDEIGQSLELPCEPVYDKNGNITGGTYRPDLIPKPEYTPSFQDRITALENEVSALKGKVQGSL